MPVNAKIVSLTPLVAANTFRVELALRARLPIGRNDAQGNPITEQHGYNPVLTIVATSKAQFRTAIQDEATRWHTEAAAAVLARPVPAPAVVQAGDEFDF